MQLCNLIDQNKFPNVFKVLEIDVSFYYHRRKGACDGLTFTLCIVTVYYIKLSATALNKICV